MPDSKNPYPIPRQVLPIFDAFEREGVQIYLVGGTVREMLRGLTQELNDFDFAAPTTPDDTGRILRKAGIRPIPIGIQFGTVGAHVGEFRIDITSFRREEKYQPHSRHPEVDFGGTIEEDLRRRDFCMNAVAMTRSGQLIDPFDGLKDIQNKHISVPSEPEKTFSDDPLRLLRAARFVSQLGFTVVPSVKKTARKMAFLITTVSRERWKMEMDKLLMGDDVHRGLEYMLEADLLNFMMPEITVLKGFNQADQYHHKDVWEHTKRALKSSVKQVDVRWALLFHDLGKPYTKSVREGQVHFYHHELVGEILARSLMFRLRFSNEQRKKVSILISNHMRPNMYDDEWNDSAVRRLARDLNGYVFDLINLSRADITSQRPETVRRGLERLDKLERRVQKLLEADSHKPVLPKGMGTEIMRRFQLEEGPEVGEYMKRLHEALDGGLLEGGREYEYYLEYLSRNAATG